MTAQTEIANVAPHRTRWQRIWAWLTALERAMDYDPQEYTHATIKDLKRNAAALDARVRDMEARHQRIG